MIVYDLVCEHDHAFEGWFKSEKDFKQQLEVHLLVCPMCESTQVRKIPTASYVISRSTDNASIGKEFASSQKQDVIKDLANYLIKNTEDVGTRFAEEARKIHYGESTERGIRGQASIQEVKELYEEGIKAFPLPGQITDKRKLN